MGNQVFRAVCSPVVYSSRTGFWFVLQAGCCRMDMSVWLPYLSFPDLITNRDVSELWLWNDRYIGHQPRAPME